jgi:hypothetical protein
MKITSETNKVFRRIHDQQLMGTDIYLGIDYSTGTPRTDLAEYYEQVEEPDQEITDTEALNIILGTNE